MKLSQARFAYFHQIRNILIICIVNQNWEAGTANRLIHYPQNRLKKNEFHKWLFLPKNSNLNNIVMDFISDVTPAT